MALDPFLDSLDDLPEDVAKEYEEGDDGKFYLQVRRKDGWELDNVKGLKKALRDERKKARKLRDYEINDDGDLLDPEEARTAMARLEELDGADPDKAAEEKWKVREDKLVRAHQKELKGERDRNANLTRQLERHLVRGEATKAIAGKAPEGVDLLLPIVTGRVRMKERDDGTFVAIVLDEDGEEALATGDGRGMTIAELVDDLSNDTRYAAAFPGDGASGGGVNAGGRKDGSKNKPRVIRADQGSTIQASLEDIASGKVVVED